MPRARQKAGPEAGSWSSLLETVSLGFLVVLAALGCTCGFESWPKPEARELLNLLLDVTEGAFVLKAEPGFWRGLQTGFPLNVSVVRLLPF